jgi:hypothetical protein
MPPTNDDTTVLVCECGKRLKAPGARPGRVGRCPACGSMLRYPGDTQPVVEAPQAKRPNRAEERPREAKPGKPSNAPIPVGSVPRDVPTANDKVHPERAKPIDTDRRAELLDAARQVGRGGFLKVPRSARFGLRDALVYPFWDIAGLSWIMFMPIGLGLPFLAVFFLIPIVLRGGDMAILGPFAFPMVIAFAFGLGYLGLIFSEVLIASTAGEVHHPKWPEIEFGALMGSLFRWSCGLVLGLSLGAIPAIQFWQSIEVHDLSDRVIAAGLVASGLLYGLMSLASIILHNELLALNPLIVIKAIFRAGFPYCQTVVLAIVVVMVAVVGIEMVDRASGSFLILPATWLAWAWIVYGGMVVCRSLGMTCHARSQKIGWFPHRPRWGASSDGIDPAIFRDKEGRRVS